MIDRQDAVIIVNEKDEWLGTMNKLEAHQKGVLHRAFSIFLFNEKGELLLQRRAAGKYHCGGLWSNACCSHPRPLESTKTAAVRRLQEELGIQDVPLEQVFNYRYQCPVDNELVENEYDHVFTGLLTQQIPQPDPEEISEILFLSPDEVAKWLADTPEDFTPWMRLLFPLIQTYLLKAA